MLGRAPEEVAKFLAKTSGLNKTMIGEYLGEREEACLRVMHAYVDAMDFAGIEFDTAIRCAAGAPFLPCIAPQGCSACCLFCLPMLVLHGIPRRSPHSGCWLRRVSVTAQSGFGRCLLALANWCMHTCARGVL